MTASSSQPDNRPENALFRLIAPAEPSRKRLLTLWIVLALWAVALVVLYFLTVRPRHPSPPERGIGIAWAADLRSLGAH